MGFREIPFLHQLHASDEVFDGAGQAAGETDTPQDEEHEQEGEHRHGQLLDQHHALEDDVVRGQVDVGPTGVGGMDIREKVRLAADGTDEITGSILQQGQDVRRVEGRGGRIDRFRARHEHQPVPSFPGEGAHDAADVKADRQRAQHLQIEIGVAERADVPRQNERRVPAIGEHPAVISLGIQGQRPDPVPFFLRNGHGKSRPVFAAVRVEQLDGTDVRFGSGEADQPVDQPLAPHVAFVAGIAHPDGEHQFLDLRIGDDVERDVGEAFQFRLDGGGGQVQHLRRFFVQLPVVDGKRVLLRERREYE